MGTTLSVPKAIDSGTVGPCTAPKDMKKSRIRDRIKQFKQPGNYTYSPVWQMIMSSATCLLAAARRDSPPDFQPSERTHWSRHSGGAVVLCLTDFLIPLRVPEEDAHALIEGRLIKRYSFVFEVFHPTEQPRLHDLETAIDVRNDIVHHFHRLDRSLKPPWFAELQSQGLLLTNPRVTAKDDFSVSQKLFSYALAKWIFDVIEVAAIALVTNTNHPAAEMAAHIDLEVFARHRAV
jgi:hypothetical protein